METTPKPSVLAENPLCSTILPSDRTQGILSTSEELGKRTFSDWLKQNGYPEEGEKLDSCSLTVEHWSCDNGHNFYFRKFRGREYCPICGAKDSYYHNRRTMRAAEHFIWAVTWGNLTYTIPKELSESRLPKENLRRLQKMAWEVTNRILKVEGAEVVVHLLGGKSEGLHVHLEVLFMRIGCFNRGMIPKPRLKAIKKVWALLLNKEFKLNLKTTDVRYSFAATHPKKWHKLKYIHRPICTEEAMLQLSDEDKKYILNLFGYHRTRYFGVLANSKIKEFLRKHWAPIKIHETPLIEKRVCPICKIHMRYKDRIFIDEIPESQVTRYNDDIWIDRAVDAYLLLKRFEGG